MYGIICTKASFSPFFQNEGWANGLDGKPLLFARREDAEAKAAEANAQHPSRIAVFHVRLAFKV